MKTIKLFTMSLLLTSFAAFASCKNNNTEVEVLAENNTEPVKTEVKTADITFKKGKLIEVALLTVKPDGQKAFMEEYFPKVMPVAVPYGAKPIASFAVTKTVMGNKPNQMVVFFEWDNVDQKRAFERNPEYLKLRNIRDNALSFLSQGYFQVENDVTVTISTDKTYDFAGLFINPEKASQLQEYFQAVLPTASKPEFGYTPIVNLNPYKGAHDQNYHPSVIAFAEWKGGTDSQERFEKTKAFKDNVAKRTAGAPYIDVFHIVPIL
ncbi:MAG: DUF1330 domain-containing protein [Winogradskyella sp.]|uniref:DUF1330 domain-containing protein n=1 Tax=Winogradskyella sp. TaxID=1883156 RepID=UPI000F3BC244|nr:DUF1330 domain-containing protein [Winogradskyella sp.]RNC85082.1 MAG: DUF1330 domain-containing protein [Winogradskyella sp.]